MSNWVAWFKSGLVYWAVVSDLILTLLNDIGGGLGEATIRGRLSSIHEEAQAEDANLKAIKAKLKKAEAHIANLEAQLEERHAGMESDRFGETAERILLILFRSSRASLEQAAGNIGVETGVAEYHADLLAQAGLVEMAGITPNGTIYVLTAKGRAYVVENKLV